MSVRDKCRVVSVTELNPFSPILVNFEFGFNSKPDNSSLKCGVYVDPENGDNKTVIIEKDDKSFIGKLLPNELSQTLLLVRNRKTNEARIYAAKSCTLYDSTREQQNVKRKWEEKENTETTTERFIQEHNLHLAFGSKRAKRASGVNMRLHQNVETNKEELMNTVSGIKIQPSDLNTSDKGEEDLMKLIPPCNRRASSAKEVYQIKDLLSDQELESLTPAAEFLINNSLTDMDEKNSYYLCSHYKLLGSNPDAKKIALLVYGNCLITFFNMKAPELRAKDSLKKICPQSRMIASKILNEFTVLANGVRTRSSFYKDKIVCFAIVLVLLACDYQLNIEILSSCLKGFGKKKLVRLARVVGLTARKGSSKVYFLKLPLPPLPKVQAPRRSTSSL